MVKTILTILFSLFIGPDTEVLVISKYCSDCQEAKIICQRLQNQGYDVEIIDLHGTIQERILARELQVFQVPTLVIRQHGNVLRRVKGVKSEGEYRSLISKKPLYYPGYTGVINFVNNSVKVDAAYVQIIKGAKSSYFSYREYNPDEHPELVKEYKITRLPTIIFIKLGKETSRYIGVQKYG